MRRNRFSLWALFCALAPALAPALPARAEAPLSAIDWLKQPAPITVAKPLVEPMDGGPAPTGATVPQVDVMPLDSAQPDAVGLLPTESTGLPIGLWQASSSADIADRFADMPEAPLPALNALYYTLLLAEADPPRDTDSDARFLHARIEALRRYGAVDAALALVERAGPETPLLFDDWLELGLLRGTEHNACRALKMQPTLTNDFPSRIYCLLREGDWPTAALTFDTANSIGLLSPHESEMLAQFIDPELAELSTELAPPRDMTPLLFRLYEASGAPLPTRSLPREYAVADLRGTTGWRTEIEAAERLARTGALPANRLLGLYTARKPAASGGVWERVRHIQAFDSAILSGDTARVAGALAPAWTAMRDSGLAVVFATLYGDRLARFDLPGLEYIQQAVTLLSPAPSIEDLKPLATTRAARFLQSVAEGQPDADLALSPAEKWIAAAFALDTPAPRYEMALADGKLGQVLLDAAHELHLAQTSPGMRSEQALAILRHIGLEDVARQTALQILLLAQP